MRKTNSSSQALVVKGNDLIVSRYNLTLEEQRLIVKVISMIRADDEDFKDYYVKVSDYVDLIGSKSSNYYHQMKEFTDKLLKKPIHIPRPDGSFLSCNWFSSIEYVPQKGALICCFDPKLKPYLLKLQRYFTAYRIENILQLDSKYSVRMYEILKRYENMVRTEIPLDELREILSVPSKYLYNDIKRRILEPAKKELRQYTDIIFEFEEIKKRKKVVAIKFIIFKNNNNINNKNENQHCLEYKKNIQSKQNVDQNKEQNKDTNQSVDRLIELIPSQEQTNSVKNYLRKVLKSYEEDYVKLQIEYVNKQKKVSNYQAYLLRAIEEDYANYTRVKQEDAKEKLRVQEVIKKEMLKLEEEKKHNIEVAIEREKSLIYQEYINSLSAIDKQIILKNYAEKAKEIDPDLKNPNYKFSLELMIERLITEDIIKNEIYQKRLEEKRRLAETNAEDEFKREKAKIMYSAENNLL